MKSHLFLGSSIELFIVYHLEVRTKTLSYGKIVLVREENYDEKQDFHF